MMINPASYLNLAKVPSLPSVSFSSFSLGSGGIFGLLAIVCILLFALSLGRTRTLVSLISIYVGFVLQAIFPYYSWIQNNSSSITKDLPTLRISFLLLAYILSFLILNRSVLKGKFGLGESSFIIVILVGMMQLGLLVSIILNLAPDYQKYIPSFALLYVANQKALFYWALVPILLLIFQRPD